MARKVVLGSRLQLVCSGSLPALPIAQIWHCSAMGVRNKRPMGQIREESL
jgi:hypothetical protein